MSVFRQAYPHRAAALPARAAGRVLLGCCSRPILVVILGSIPDFREPSPDLGGSTVIALYVGDRARAQRSPCWACSSCPSVLATLPGEGRSCAGSPPPRSPGRPARRAAGRQPADRGGRPRSLVLAVGRIAFGVALPGQVAGFVLALPAQRGRRVRARPAHRGARADRQGRQLDRHAAVLPVDVLRRPVDAARGAARRRCSASATSRPLGAGERALHDAPAGHWPQLLPIGRAGGLRSGVRCGRRAALPLGVRTR